MRTYEDILLYIYKSYSESYKVSFIKRKFLTIAEFKTFLNDAQIFCDTFNERDSELGFYQSMMTQVNELTNEKHV